MQPGRPDYRGRTRPPQIVEKWQQTGNRILLEGPDTALEVSAYAAHSLRFRFAPEGRFEDDFSYAVVKRPDEFDGKFSLRKVGDEFHIRTEELVVKVSNTLNIKVFNKQGQLLSEDERGFYWEPFPSRGGNQVFYNRKIQENEYFFGLGDKPGRLNLRGLRFENWGSDTYGYDKNSDPLYKSIPFFIGLHHGLGYGVFFDNTFKTRFDFGHDRGDICTFWSEGGEMDFYFIYGPEMMAVSERYAQLTGIPEMPPLWALGYHQSKWSYFPESKVMSVANEFRIRKIPCDAIHIDIDYMDGFRCFTWDRQRFADPRRMVQDLLDDGFKTVVIIDPGIKTDKDYAVYQEALEKGYFCRRADGPLMEGNVWPGKCSFPDFTHPAVREWWAGLFKDFLKSGIRGIWNDMNEPALFEIGTFPEDTRHDFDGHPCSHRKAHNVYGTQMARATFEGIRKYMYPHRPFAMSRAGYAGVQRFASVWTGDNLATWEHLWIANIQVQRLSISAVSFAGSDIGGFIGRAGGELYVRWLQMGAFQPFFRTHYSGDYGDQEPWSFGDKWTALAKKAIETRYRILPYIYTAFWNYTRKGTPVIRPISFIDQDDVDTLFRMDEFGVGPDMLVCPITREGDLGRLLYLPAGEWYNFWTSTVLDGKQEVFVEAPLDQIPVFIRAGAVIPQFPLMQYVGEISFDSMPLHVYYKKGKYTSELYEDAGDFFGHDQGNYRMHTFETEGSGAKLEIRQAWEGRFNSEYSSYELHVHGLPFIPAGMLLEGKPVMFDRDFSADQTVFKFTVDKKFESIVLMRLDGFADL